MIFGELYINMNCLRQNECLCYVFLDLGKKILLKNLHVFQPVIFWKLLISTPVSVIEITQHSHTLNLGLNVKRLLLTVHAL